MIIFLIRITCGPANCRILCCTEFFNFQNDLLSELGCIIQRKMESSDVKVQHQLGELYQKAQKNAELSKKLQRIRSQTNSLHEALVGK